MMARWKPIEDLPESWSDWRSSYLEHFVPLWLERKALLTNAVTLDEFNLKLMREWSIETGVIESLYTIDRGITQLLIEKGIKEALFPKGFDRPVVEVVAMLRDHEATIGGIFEFVRGGRPLSV